MTLAVAVLAVAVILLTFLVAGLLRSHAVILRKLHELGVGVDVLHAPSSATDTASGPPAPPLRSGPAGRAGHDIVGTDLDGNTVGLRTVGVEHDTVVVFLSSGCLTCATFWDELAHPVPLPVATRLVIVTQDAVDESPAALRDLAPPGVSVVLSSQAWIDHGIPGSPYVLLIAGDSGRTVGEGTGASWAQVARSLAQSTGDVGFTTAETGRRKVASDRARERDTDAELLTAGFVPGDPRLYEPLPAHAADDELGHDHATSHEVAS